MTRMSLRTGSNASLVQSIHTVRDQPPLKSVGCYLAPIYIDLVDQILVYILNGINY